MTKAFLIVSVACNVWFLFLLFYDRIMDTKLIRFLVMSEKVCKILLVLSPMLGKPKHEGNL